MNEVARMRDVVLRFDMRCAPQCPNTPAERYRSVLEMSQWADCNSVDVIGLSEHHDTSDGILCVWQRISRSWIWYPLDIGLNSLRLFEQKVQPYL
jgi:hypothetical protein